MINSRNLIYTNILDLTPFKKIYYDLLLVVHQSTKFLQSFTKKVCKRLQK